MLILHIALGILLACAVLFVIGVAIATLNEVFGPIDWTIGTVLLLLALLALAGCLAVFALVVLLVLLWTAPGFGVAILLVLAYAVYDWVKTHRTGTLRRLP